MIGRIGADYRLKADPYKNKFIGLRPTGYQSAFLDLTEIDGLDILVKPGSLQRNGR